MRVLSFLAMLALMTVSLSGCLGFGDDDEGDEDDLTHGDDCEEAGNMTHEECHAMENGGGNETVGNETDEPELPNQIPNASLTITANGTELNGTSFVTPGTNVTFSAEGSSDPDGQVSLIGLTVTDTNGTRNAQLIDASGTFTDATFRFDHVGPVNVTVRVLDDDGEGVIRTAFFAVNEVVAKEESFEGPSPPGDADDCTPPGSGTAPPLVTNAYSAQSKFAVQAGAQWIEATVTGGSAEIAICSPDGEALSTAGESVATEDGNGTLPVNAQYYVMVLAGGGGTVTIDVMVHYEPKP